MKHWTNHGPAARLAAAAVAATLAHHAAAQPRITQLFREGDGVVLNSSDIVAITSFGGVAVNNAGQTLVEVTTNFTAASNVVVLLDGAVAHREDDPVAGGSLTLSAFDSIRLNSAGHRAWNLGLRNATTNTDAGIFYNGSLVIQEGTASTATAFTPGTPYIGFFEVLIDDNDDFFVMASIDDPAISSSVDRAAVIFAYDPSNGTFTETVLAKEGDSPLGLVGPIVEFSTGPESMARSVNGQHQAFIAEVSGGLNDAIWLDGSFAIHEGDASPAPGRAYRILNDIPLDVNNAGIIAFRCTLDGDTATDIAIVKGNASIVAQEGGAVPAFPGFTFTGFGSSPVHIDDNGDVTYYGVWNDAESNHALFRNETPIMREGITTVGGAIVLDILGVSEGWSQSPDGRYMIVKVRYDDNDDAVLLVDFEPGCPADLDNDGDFANGASPDDTVDINDLLFFLAAFEGGSVLVDLDNDGDAASGDPDGATDINDLLFFLARFEAGC